jgi:predicted nucleic acid-binding protein
VILVDSSVWIDFFTQRENLASAFLTNYLQEQNEVAFCDVVAMEVLQGIPSAAVARKIESALKKREYLNFESTQSGFIAAARLYARCRVSGVTPRSAMDCVIAQLAIEHQVPLLHNDRDFIHIERVEPKLKHIHFLGSTQ